MGAFYYSGSHAVTPGVLEESITGLALPEAPSSVVVTVRLPDADADAITAFIIGAPTYDGFTVGYSAEPGEGYQLEWTASFAESGVVPDGVSNAVRYDDLFDLVRRFLGYGETLTDMQTQNVDECVQAGVRQFYYPPKVEGADENHTWSFLRMRGQIYLSPGIYAYALPDGFGTLIGVITYSATDHLPSINNVSEEVVRGRLARHPEQGDPRICSISYKTTFGQRGQHKEADFWPIPAAARTLEYVADADTGKLDPENRPFPLGGAQFSELVRESCLAKAEQLVNDETGQHTALFGAQLVAAIARDRKNSAADYGDMSFSQDPGAYDGLFARRNLVHGLRITYNGQEL